MNIGYSKDLFVESWGKRLFSREGRREENHTYTYSRTYTELCIMSRVIIGDYFKWDIFSVGRSKLDANKSL
jgi:hypothetical protein